uniref:Uncharacterized protein n=1 Tax=Pristionchus pacificus TaxID=54126 RepID=A0A8R1UGD1_PRIPA
MGLFEPTFLRVKVTRGATVCSVIQMILAVVLAVFPMIRGLKKLLYPLREWEPFDCHFLAENLTILIAIFLLLSAILILIGNSKKRYLFFVPALIIQVCNFVLTIGAFFTIGIHYLSGDHEEHMKHEPNANTPNVTTTDLIDDIQITTKMAGVDLSHDLDIFICLSIAILLQYIFSVFYFKSFDYLRVFRI